MLRKLCQCMGLSSLVLLIHYADLLGGGQSVRLHAPLALTGICLAQSADILLLGLFYFLILAPLQRTSVYPALRLLLAIGIPFYILQRTRGLFPFILHPHLLRELAIVWAALLLLLVLRFPVWYGRILRFGGAVGAAFALFAFLSIAQMLWVIRWQPLPQQYSAAWATSPQPPRSHPLLVWIVFDELSYDQTFEHRAQGLALPNFDTLRSQSMLFTDVQPAGYKTAKVIPSLLRGKIIDDFRYDMQRHFSVHYAGGHGWHALNGGDTVFKDAQENGWRTAVVGWYNPYCTIYRDAIDDCYWGDRDVLNGPMAVSDSLWQNTLSPLQRLARHVVSRQEERNHFCSAEVRHHYESHIELEQHAFQLLHTDQADFVFLHLAVPHSPNIWNRRTGQYTQTCGSSYLDNLALADREMGLILKVLQSSPRWSDTTLIVEGDHSWRIPLWFGTPEWTHEDDTASRDIFDTRPALLIHRAGQAQPETIATPWPLLRVHDVVEQVLQGQPLRP